MRQRTHAVKHIRLVQCVLFSPLISRALCRCVSQCQAALTHGGYAAVTLVFDKIPGHIDYEHALTG
jgi:hypothetical protein